MKNIHRLLALLLSVALLMSLISGCGKEPSGDLPDKNITPAVTVPEVELNPLTEDEKLQGLPSRAPGDGGKDYTVMIYMVGSNLESTYGSATSDMNEILRSGLDTGRVNVLVYTGGSRYWHSGIPSDCNVVYRLTSGGWEAVAATATANNMGDPSTLLDFMNYAYTTYPAEHYGLICWDHGGGSLIGFGSDELYNNDNLFLTEMDAAFAASPFADKKLDFLGFDACLMASMEVAEMASRYAHYLIASEENEPGSGWDYSFLGTLNDTLDTRTLGLSILLTYESSLRHSKFNPEYTLSLLDLSQVSSFRRSADQLFRKMAEGVKNGSYSAIAQARQKTLRFAATSEYAFDMVDIGDMAAKLAGLYSSEASALQNALSLMVVSQVSNIDGTCGLSVYYPYDNKSTYENLGAVLHPYLTESDGFEAFMAAFTDYWINGEPAASFTEHEVAQPEVVTPTQPTEPAPTEPNVPSQPVTPPTVQPEGTTISLSADQLANLSGVTYTVFAGDIDRSSGQKVYIPVLSDVPLEPDASGTVTLPADQKLIVLRTDAAEEGILWPTTYVSSGGGIHYISTNAYLTATTDTVSGTERFSLYFANSNTDRMNILSMTTIDGSDSADRGEPDLTQWEYIANRYTTLFPTCNNAGNISPYTLWDDSGDEYYSLLPYDEEFWLEQVSMTALDEEFYFQILLHDTQGNTYATALSPYTDGPIWAEYHENGFVYRLYADHATVVDYTGPGGSITVPTAVGGIPVTEIGTEAFYYNRDITDVTVPASVHTVGARAFANCRNLTSVLFLGAVKTIRSEAFSRAGLSYLYLPEGVERIEHGAFSHTALTVVNLPASVSYLGSGVFADCTALIGFTVAMDPNGSSPYYKAVNGLLLTADGKELVQAPLNVGIHLNIPTGVEIIRSGAVRGSETLQKVTLPEGLKEIRSYAFYDTLGLQSLQLPESLEIIGNSAFGQFGVSVNLASPVTSVTIGPNVRHIGYDAFDAFPIGNFQVDSRNAYYSAKNGHLLSKSGTVFHHAAYTFEGTLEIPAGVNHLAFHSLNMCDDITALVLSDSVVSMDAHTGLPEKMKSLRVGKSLTRWDNISDAYYLDSVQISDTNPHFVMVDGCVYSRDLNTLYACLGEQASVSVLEGVTTLADTAFAPATGRNTTITAIQLPTTVSYLSGELFMNLTALENVTIAEDNPYYASHDGLVYTENGVSLILCPQGKTGTVSVKVGTSTIWRYAFYGQLQASRIVIPEGVMTIRKGNFVTYRSQTLDLKLPSTLENIYPDMLHSPGGYSVTCPKGSAADVFARSRGASVSNKK